ncbi:uncharacterized oxidoreductase ORF334-like [Ptychodera flava]|uniref:uncharacterized oxidoreductase ORF334-like n=1 Tax=Ptychodera flava TaxID=63121 RepID=UPI00396A8761
MLRWGILSCAGINKRFIPEVKKCPRSKLIGMASRSLEKAQVAAKEWDIPKAYGSYEELLLDKEINAVYIPLPNSMHAEWAIRAAQNGKHCLVEKPIATKVSDVEKLQKVAKNNNVTIVEAYVYLHHPQFQAIKDKIQSGCIGDVTHMSGSFDMDVRQIPDALMLKANLESGSLWLLGCYPVSFMIALMGCAPQTVTAFKQQTESGVDATFHSLMQFSNGVQGCISCSGVTSNHSHFEIAGNRGRLRSNKERCFHPDTGDIKNSYELQISGNKAEEIHVKNVNAFEAEILAFEDTVLDGKVPIVPLDLSRKIVATLAAMHESANQNGAPLPVKL